MSSDQGITRILCIVSSMNTGGAETFLMKIYRALDKSKYQMDFYCMSEEEGYYEREITELGGRIYHSIPKSKNLIKSFILLRKFVKKHKYNIVMRVSEHSLSTIDLLAAKFGGAKILIQRSSNANSGNQLNRLLHKIFNWLPKTIPTIKIAPSTEAAEYRFGKGCVNKGKVVILKNAIPLGNFLYCSERREKIREELKINDKFVVGHIGRFSKQKNHDFLLDIFSEIVNLHNDSVLLLVGQGSLEKNIREKIDSLNMNKHVIFTGIRSDIPELLMAMDVFIFPSLYEGLPNAVIEAQATGLPCIVSSEVTREVKIIDEVKFLSLNESPKKWAKTALKCERNLNRDIIRNMFIKKGYDIRSVVQEFISLLEK